MRGLPMKATPAHVARRLVRAEPDDRWAAVFGRIAVYSFLVALLSGILLLPFFQDSMMPVVYHGSYRKLDGLTMSRAYQSTLVISFDVRGGLLIRQVHHWSADLFVAAVCLRLIRVYFRGRFRLPDWLIWVGLLLAGMLAGLSGTILPDDMVSGGSEGGSRLPRRVARHMTWRHARPRVPVIRGDRYGRGSSWRS